MSRSAELAGLLEGWRDGDGDADADLVDELTRALADPVDRRRLRGLLRQQALLHFSAMETCDEQAFAAEWRQRLELEGDRRRFAAQWRRRAHRAGRPRQILLLAAGLLLSVAVGLLAWHWPQPAADVILIDRVERLLQPGLVVAAAAEPRRIQWPSRALDLQLAPGGRLRWLPEDAGLVVRLDEGTADCRVDGAAAQRPLTMRLPHCLVRVVGTRWHCQASATGSAVAVEYGHVAVRVADEERLRAAGELVVVRPGQGVRWERGDRQRLHELLADEDVTAAEEPPESQPEAPIAGPPPPVVRLLPDVHQAPDSEAVLRLAAAGVAPFHSLVLPEEQRQLQGDGPPNPWSLHNWEEEGRSEVFHDRVAGQDCLVLRNVEGHGILLGQWRPVQLPPGSSWRIVLRYRCRERGRLAVAIKLDGRRSETVQAPRVLDRWHTAVFAFDVPATGAEHPCTVLLLNQTVGAAHDVLLRSVALHPGR